MLDISKISNISMLMLDISKYLFDKYLKYPINISIYKTRPTKMSLEGPSKPANFAGGRTSGENNQAISLVPSGNPKVCY
jgi:hypothetical protein